MGETMAGIKQTRIVFLLLCLLLISAQGVLLATDGAPGPDQSSNPLEVDAASGASRSTNPSPPLHRIPYVPDRAHSPNLIVGVPFGLNYRAGRALEVDAVSGASRELPDTVYRHADAATGLFFDFSFLDAGPGNVGLQGNFYYSFPDTYYDFGLVPRYRFVLALPSTTAPTIEPWAGLGAWLTYADEITSDYYFVIGTSFGADVQLFTPGFYLGLGFDVALANPVPVREDVIIDGERHTLERRINNFTSLLRISYQIF